MNQLQQEWTLAVVAQRQREAEEYRRAQALALPLRSQMALWLRRTADRLDGARASLTQTAGTVPLRS